MATLDTKQTKANSKLHEVLEAVMALAAKMSGLLNQLIDSLVEVAKAHPSANVTFTDVRLSEYRHMGLSTYCPGVASFYNVCTGKTEKTMKKGEGTPKTGTARAVQEALARIAGQCDSDLISELLGYTDQSDKEVAPTLSDLKQYKSSVVKSKRSAENTVSPTKIVGQTPMVSEWDMSKLEIQLKRIPAILADCPSQQIVNQLTKDVAALGNSFNTLLRIEDAKAQAKAIDTRDLVNDPKPVAQLVS